MIEVNNTYITADISQIITELKNELAINGIQRFYKSIDTPKNYMICCPFHKNGQEKKPSMGILKSDGTCHCFACNWVGSLPEMISNVFGYDDFGNYGSKWLIKNFLTLKIEDRDNLSLDFARNSQNGRVNCQIVPESELDTYRYNHPYWKKRGITSEYIIELFDLGYDSECKCITFPNRDTKGNCVFIARRSVRTKYFNYPSGVEKPVYGLYELNKVFPAYKNMYHNEKQERVRYIPDLIVCESMLDALSFWQVGMYAVALNGTGTELQYKQLRQLSCRKLILATDMDRAGMQAREKLVNHLSNKILTQYMFPDGIKDANQCLCDLGEDSLRNLKEIFI